MLTLLLLAFAGSAHAATKPTVVLVHGAWADSGAWDGVTARLQARGYPVRVVATPLRSLSGDAAYVSSLLTTIPGPVVLVGHSYGGAVVTNAAAANVKRLVYVDAFAPDQGETVLHLATQRPGSALAADPMTVFDPVPYPGAPAGDVQRARRPVRAARVEDDPELVRASHLPMISRPGRVTKLIERAAAGVRG